MATDRQTIRDQLRDDLRIDPNGKVWSDSVLNQLIHEAEIELARRNITITELETSDTFSTVIGQRTYDLGTSLNSVFSRIISVIYDVETVANYTASTIAFVDSNPDTITDTANGFVTAGFTAGMKLQVYNSTSNDGVDTLEIATVAAGTLTLVSGDTVTAESAGASISLIGRSDPSHQTVMRRVEDVRQFNTPGVNNVAGYPTRYAVNGNDLYFNVLPKEVATMQVQYVKIPDEMTTDGTNSDIPDELIPLVRLWAEYRAWGQVPGEEANQNDALQKFERELRRKITMRGLDDYALRQYNGVNWRAGQRPDGYTGRTFSVS